VKRLTSIGRAFVIGAGISIVAIIALRLFADFVGVPFQVTSEAAFSIPTVASPVLRASWWAPLFVGLLFAAVQFFDEHRKWFEKIYAGMMTRAEWHQLAVVLFHALGGAAAGFVISVFLLTLLVGSHGEFVIPFFLTAFARGNEVSGSSAIVSVAALVGLLVGLLKLRARPVKKRLGKAKGQVF
jgi:hypothetical protein